MVRSLFSKKRGSDGISSFEAFCIALSGRVGTGNIVGVATAIAFGGPGAIFWMWVVAFFGASTAFVECHCLLRRTCCWLPKPGYIQMEGLQCWELMFRH